MKCDVLGLNNYFMFLSNGECLVEYIEVSSSGVCDFSRLVKGSFSFNSFYF